MSKDSRDKYAFRIKKFKSGYKELVEFLGTLYDIIQNCDPAFSPSQFHIVLASATTEALKVAKLQTGSN